MGQGRTGIGKLNTATLPSVTRPRQRCDPAVWRTVGSIKCEQDHIARKCGLESSDLPDWMYIDAFEDGASPAAAARDAIKAAEEF